MSGSRFPHIIYVGNLPMNVKEWEIEDLFYKYGRVLDIELKIPPHSPAYCFLEFQNSCDAQDAIRGRNGYYLDGSYLMVELAHGGGGPSSSSDPHSNYGGGGPSPTNAPHSNYGGVGGHYGIERRQSEYRVIVRGIPSSTSLQDLKNHMQKAGDVCFAEVSRDSEGTFGIVDYTNYEDMKYAIRRLDRADFGNPWTRTYIRVKMYEGSPSRSQSRSRSPRNKRSKYLNFIANPFSLSLELSLSMSPSTSRSRSISASPEKTPIDEQDDYLLAR
ncbi:serine/arginine-rich splicing factor SR34A-like isoform X1 [Impatiens glandulifera]|uniref:serine/arginine-rich splicing factor SR34A-like isoform X1 n=1 Tax=Impatiens glandulifera TaxID=253017 RepID=UPI001FB081D6|nr:serine/arginine-rich splicing factor SR34A-like isoform X1 [Impatiens glandulifera]